MKEEMELSVQVQAAPALPQKNSDRVSIYLTYKLRGLSPQANYTDRAAAAGR